MDKFEAQRAGDGKFGLYYKIYILDCLPIYEDDDRDDDRPDPNDMIRREIQ